MAKDLAANGIFVLVGTREQDQGRLAVNAIGENAGWLRLDVTDDRSIRDAADTILSEFGCLDILVNNAAISHAGKDGTPLVEIGKRTKLSTVSLEEVRSVFETNVFGVIAVTQAMLPLLKLSPAARIVNVSSGAGSLGSHSNPTNPARSMFGTYSISKTAVNAVTVAFSIDLEKSNIKVNAVCPGFTCTGLNNFEGSQTVEQGAREAVRIALSGAQGRSGTFSSFGGPMSW
ncbi:SDR family NAD(P)-dependent oxidoreductase [Microbulbifer sp. OS29]|uniref:SDR family NAD(P)-dependent oxidoreductase n=1 Tax=Microbulbifer okhotskensis TaxID=2926617 RepID=A0A9X2ESK5_9GAMM|nr:SDR family NAD(P)-dependent oxidoreductase [Microbulbifer okhotskensis]